MPSSKGYVRNYKQEAATAKGRGEQGVGPDSGSAVRHRARREAKAMGMVVAGKDVDHKTPISKGGGNAKGNLRAEAPSKNRSFPRNSKGGMVKNGPKK